MPVSNNRVKQYVGMMDNRLRRAVSEYDRGTSIRAAAEIAGLPPTTFVRQVAGVGVSTRKKRTALTDEEENSILHLIAEYSALGHPLRDSHIQDAVELIAERMLPERREKLPFANGRPGRKFIRGFRARHGDALKYSFPRREESVRFNSTNADHLTTHIAAELFARIISMHKGWPISMRPALRHHLTQFV